MLFQHAYRGFILLKQASEDGNAELVEKLLKDGGAGGGACADLPFAEHGDSDEEEEGAHEDEHDDEDGDKLVGKAKAEATPLAHAVARYLGMSNLHTLAKRASDRVKVRVGLELIPICLSITISLSTLGVGLFIMI